MNIISRIIEKFQNPYLIDFSGLFGLICLTIIITLIGLGVILLHFPVESAFIIAVPMIITYLTVYLMIFTLNMIFNYYVVNWVKNKPITYESTLIKLANSQETGIIQSLNRLRVSIIPKKYRVVGIVVALIGLLLEIGIGFDIRPITVPDLLSIKGEKFYADPLTPCNVGDAACPQSFQSKFRFQWVKEASDIMTNGISKKLSLNWGDISDGRIVMVATTDNHTSINYKLVQNEKGNIPVFCLTTKCDTISNNNETFRNLTIQKQTPILEAIKEDPWLENRWMAEVINLQPDNLNETTRITVNLVQISPLNSPCEGSVDIIGNFQLCRPTKGIQIFCLMNTYVNHAKSIKAGCDCGTEGLNFKREEYSSPKPLYGDYMHNALASYGGHILIPQCLDDSVGGCSISGDNVDQIKD